MLDVQCVMLNDQCGVTDERDSLNIEHCVVAYLMTRRFDGA